MNLETTFLGAKRVIPPIIAFLGYIAMKVTDGVVQFPEQTIIDALMQAVQSTESLVAVGMILWNTITKLIDKSRSAEGKPHLSWWDAVGIFQELMKVLKSITKK